MAFDGIMTAAVTYELNHTLQGGKIEKVYQPEAEELVFNIHSKSGKLKLYISSSGNHAGIYLGFLHAASQALAERQNYRCKAGRL